MRNVRIVVMLWLALLSGADLVAQNDSIAAAKREYILKALKPTSRPPMSASNSPGQSGEGYLEARVDTLPRTGHGKVIVHQSRGIDSLEKAMRGVQRLEGFRIQIFLGSYRDAMEWRRKFSESGLGYPSYALPNTPDYMVLVGDFRTRFEAQKALKDIKKSYPGAFILPGVIEPPVLPVRKG
ncbi:MAG: SPOR domain-containing protein [Flavobacteriales bacterium]|nr:SPOR domain-containing protein [Flavobacteriales bacterium]